MSVLRCKMCGAVLPQSKDSVVECEYCRTKQTLPRMADEKCRELFDRANSYRQQKDFDSAASVYNDIIGEFPNEPEAYWGLCLCRYGIEYVVDPKSGRRIPTCHRTQFKSILDSSDYKSAIEKADAEARRVYESEARVIDGIQKGILEISSKEDPFDVFICYKETDDMGRRTQDSVIAQKIYDELTRDGLRVFFARITLEDKLGEKYEPYIFAALNSSRVMLVVGTKPEHFNAVWVKNEWSRFLELAATDPKKKIYPCYYEMSPYALPHEFKGLQSQDCDKIGFEQDLLRGIRKIVPKKTEEKPKVQEVVYTAQPVNADEKEKNAMYRRILMLIESGEWKQADEKCEGMLDKYPDEAAFYFYKVVVGEHLGNNVKYFADKLARTKEISDVERQYLNSCGYMEYLKTAAKYGIVHAIKYIVSTYPSALKDEIKIDHGNNETSTVNILSYAVWNNYPTETVKTLLDCGANANSKRLLKNAWGVTEHPVINDAAWTHRNEKIFALLLGAGADPNSFRTYRNRYGMTEYSVLGDAIWNAKSLSMTKMLLDAGADPNRIEDIIFDSGNHGKKSMMTYAVVDANSVEIVRLLLAHGAAPDSTRMYENQYGDTEYSALGDAIWNTKNVEMVRILINAGADPDRVEDIIFDNGSRGRKSMLTYAIADAQSTEMVRMLLESGATWENKISYGGITKVERKFPYGKFVDTGMTAFLKTCGWKGPLFG